MLTIEGCTPIIFGSGDTRDCRQIVCTERVILLAKKALAPPVRLSRIDPIVHDPPAYECRNLGGLIPSVQQQSVAVVRALIDGQLSERHWSSLACYRLLSPSARHHVHMGMVAPFGHL